MEMTSPKAILRMLKVRLYVGGGEDSATAGVIHLVKEIGYDLIVGALTSYR